MANIELKEAFQKYGHAVYRAAYAVTGNKPDAEDVFQDTFFALYKRTEPFACQEHVKAWLLRVAVNKAKNIKKSAWVKNRCRLTDDIPASQIRADGNEVLDAMQKLKPIAAAVLYLHYYEGYTLREVAELLQMRESSIRSIASRAREKMKTYLE